MVTKEIGSCVSCAVSWERQWLSGGKRGLPVSSARERTGLSMPSFGLNLNFLQGGRKGKRSWQLDLSPQLS